MTTSTEQAGGSTPGGPIPGGPTPGVRASAVITPGARFRRIGGGLSLLVAGTLVWVSLLMIPYENQTPEAYLRTGVDHPANILWAAVVLHYGFLLLLPAALTLVRLARRRARRTALAALVLSGLGAGLSGAVTVDYYDVALARALPMEEALRVYELAGSYGQNALILLPSVLGLSVGINLAVFAAWRAGAIPLMPLVLNVVGWGIFSLFPGDAWLPSLGTGLAAAGLAWCGTIVLRMRDEAWNGA